MTTTTTPAMYATRLSIVYEDVFRETYDAEPEPDTAMEEQIRHLQAGSHAAKSVAAKVLRDLVEHIEIDRGGVLIMTPDDIRNWAGDLGIEIGQTDEVLYVWAANADDASTLTMSWYESERSAKSARTDPFFAPDDDDKLYRLRVNGNDVLNVEEVAP